MEVNLKAASENEASMKYASSSERKKWSQIMTEDFEALGLYKNLQSHVES